MNLPWFRLYSRMVDDDKLRLLAFEDRWHFVALCCLKSDGLLDAPDSDIRNRRIAVKLGVQVRELEEIGRRLQEVGLVDKLLNPVAWDALQFKSDNSTARVKNYREKQQRNDVKRFSNVAVTVQETDTDTEQKEANASRATDVAPKPDGFVEAWNDEVAPLGKRRVTAFSPERRTHVKSRLREHGIDGCRQVLANIRGSPFLIDAKGIQFDWVIQKKNFLKILEGNYNG